MPRGTRAVVGLALVLVLVSAAPASAVAHSTAPTPSPASATADVAAGDAAAGTAVTAADEDTIHVRTTLSLTPERPGEVDVTLRFDVPDRVSELSPTVDARATGVETDGFAAAGDGTYEWDGDTASPTISYRLPANQTVRSSRLAREDRGGGAGAVSPADLAGDAASVGDDGGYRFVDTGPWALVSTPTVSVSFRYYGDTQPRVVRDPTVNGPGAVGERIAFLGEHEVHEHTAHGQTFRLVVPAAASDSMRVEPAAVFDSLASASDSMRVGDRDESVFLVAAPTGVDWGVAGLQTGDADAWVRADEPLDAARNAWLHEYVHTRQAYRTTPETRWTIEGSATYYAAALALRQDRIDFRTFADALARGERDAYADAVLADPDTWTADAQYRKGALVAGDLDRRIRLASDGGATLGTVLRRLNAESDASDPNAQPISEDRLLDVVADVADDAVADDARRFTRTEATPEAWSAEEHEAAFGRLAAQIRISSGTELRVNGSSRNATVGPTPTVAVGETVSVPVEVENVGGESGDYRVTLTVDGAPVANATGTLSANAAETRRLSWTPNATGTYRVGVPGRTYEVRVSEPDPPAVSSLSVDRSTVAVGESVTLEATVVAGNSVPTVGDLAVRVDGERVGTESVSVAPGETRTVRIPVSFDGPGEHTVAVGDERVTITVTADATTTDADDRTTGGEQSTSATVDPIDDDRNGTDTSLPGLGAGGALAALALSVVLAALGRNRDGQT
ncbi:hypothetical protein Hbl1158_14260 [Halobaculum sp. CBA1158]|uniref:CARDB domain-containing protein n=1 Tax=Halobaculum sp. CBA1158 TaxID=2904243 RepID=UPI001F2E232F|nr:CARDB domain-containing protein [Halobaculum sp. CBA1158]UIO99669.1 hypothetical protein Hbl1158_14260 [Halobaculum sp. CBA1158]